MSGLNFFDSPPGFVGPIPDHPAFASQLGLSRLTPLQHGSQTRHKLL